MLIPLSALPPGGQGRILAIGKDCAMKRRLLDLGFVPGARVQCLFESASGNPRAYLAQGAVMALRRAQAGQILTQREE